LTIYHRGGQVAAKAEESRMVVGCCGHVFGLNNSPSEQGGNMGPI